VTGLRATASILPTSSKADVDLERERDAAHEARGAAACRRAELWNAKGWLINSSEMWLVPDTDIRTGAISRISSRGKPTPDVIVEPVVSKVTKVWTTVFARKITGRNGEVIGLASRGVEPTHFEAFVGSLSSNSDTAIR
jgi:hypothetical protein